MDEPQPELRWAPLPPPPKKTGRVWLIIGLSAAALVIVGLLLFFLLPRGDDSVPESSASPSPTFSPSPSASSSEVPSTVPPSEPDPAETPRTTPPPATAPAPEVFRERVSGWLNDAPRGLDIVERASGRDALPVVETLQQDVQRLSDAQPPESLAADWHEAVNSYSDRLTKLHSAISDDSDVAGAVDAARAAAQDLRALVGL